MLKVYQLLLPALVLLLFSVRQYIGHKQETLEEARRIDIHYDDIKMIALSGIQIEGGIRSFIR